MKLQDLFYKFISEYDAELNAARKEENFKRPFGNLVRQNIVSEIKAHLQENIYKVKGSVGAGRWTDVPWIAVFDKRITESAQRGVYIVYLLNKDTKELFLTLNQGATDVAQGGNGSRKLAFTGIATASNGKTTENLHARAKSIRSKIGPFDGLKSDSINTGAKSYDAGCIYYVKYTLDSLPDDEELYSDLRRFIEAYQAYYKNVFLVSNSDDAMEEGEEDLQTDDKLIKISEYIYAKGFRYDDSLLKNFYLSLKSKPFVLLAGTSGTGKTKLVKLFAEAIGAEYKLVSVRPDWSDSSDLFGHTNLQGVFVPGAITEYVKAAIDDPDKPYILCLDEMNLARVEYYFSDVLSLIETRKSVNGRIETESINIDDAGKEKYGVLYIPDNLYFVGTVNMDETTYPFSKKVLDRANTIEFSEVELIPSFDVEARDAAPIAVGNEFLAAKYLTLLTDIDESQRDIVTKVCTELQSINEILRKTNAHVGYRVRDEIVFYMLNNDESKLLEYETALDFEIMQKILPRIQGSTQGIKELLVELFKKCAGDYSSFSQDCIWKQMDDYLKNKASIYPKSAEKICYMMRRFEEDGFTSYWL